MKKKRRSTRWKVTNLFLAFQVAIVFVFSGGHVYGMVDEPLLNLSLKNVVVKDALLAEALKALTERKRDVILLSYFMEMNDADIARKLNLVRSTVHEHRTRSLEILKAMLEENVNENGRKKCK